MREVTAPEKKLRGYDLRASLPTIARYSAIVVAGIVILIVAVAFFNGRRNNAFKIKGYLTELSTDVIAEINGYERLESDGTLAKYFVKADRARTFSDNHQEFENVYIKTFNDAGEPADQIVADQALYIPEDDRKFTAYLKGSVSIETRDHLKIRSDTITYSKKDEVAETEDPVEFERENIRGRSVGAHVDIANKKADLLKDVEIETFESKEKMLANIRYAKLNSTSASYDQASNLITLNGSFKSNIDSGERKTDISADRAVAMLAGNDEDSRQLKKIELFDNVRIVSKDGETPTNIDSGYAMYDKDADRFELKNGSHIVTAQDSRSTEIRSTEAVYERTGMRITLNGEAQVAQPNDYVKGNSMLVTLFPGNKVKTATVTGNTFLKQNSPERLTQVSADQLNITYSEPDTMHSADALGNARAELIPSVQNDYSKVTMTAPNAIKLSFKGLGLLDDMRTDGRTTIQLDVPDNASDAANKRVTADQVRTYFNDAGKDIRRTEAVGNAELFVQPKRPLPENYVTAINAPRFDCDFYPTGNNARVCVGGTKTKTVRTPTIAAADRPVQTMTADKLTANFDQTTKDIQQLDATGSSKYVEGSRNATASAFTFTQNDRTLRLRGGEPTMWDDRSRAKARQIDWNTATQIAELRGGVSTTFYSGSTMGGSPFSRSDKPVFVTSENAQFDKALETAVYLGNARGWQGDNYVRSDKLVVKQATGQLYAEGNVQSALYDAKMKRGDKESNVPVFAQSRTMNYDKNARTLIYNDNVDIRQGTDRITSGTATVYLSENNEMQKTIAERSVVITQPGRKAVGDWVQYTADDEVAILRGNPATVNDADNGGSQSSQITVYMRENRFVGEGRVRQNPNARVKSVYKVKPQ